MSRKTEFDPERYWQARLAKEFTLGGVGQTGWGVPFNAWAYRAKRRVFLGLLRSLEIDFASADVLDVGTGTGFYFDRWAELGAKSISGIDLTDVAVAGLRQRYSEGTFHKIDIGETPGELRGKRFDAVSCIDVLYHIVDDHRYQTAIQNIYHLVTPGGYFILTEGGVENSIVRADYIIHRGPSAVRRTLLEAGFRIVTRRPFLLLMNQPVDRKRRLLNLHWSVLRKLLRRAPAAGKLVGPALYVLERAAALVVARPTSTEIIVCRRPIEDAP